MCVECGTNESLNVTRFVDLVCICTVAVLNLEGNLLAEKEKTRGR